MNFGVNGPEKIITRANLKASLQAYDDVRIHHSSIASTVKLTSSSYLAHEHERELSSRASGHVKSHR